MPKSLILLVLLVFPTTAQAYAGLGPLVPMIGNGIMLLFFIGVTAVGIVAYPLMTVLEKVRKKNNNRGRVGARSKV